MNAVLPSITPSLSSVVPVTDRILATGKITHRDRLLLHSLVLCDRPLSPEELRKTACVLDRLNMGLLEIVD